jgi:uncharacterized FAD-dependent dehydrogenase
MPIEIELKILPEAAADPEEVKLLAAEAADIPLADIAYVKIVRKSLDARKQQIVVLLKAEIYRNGEPVDFSLRTFDYKPVNDTKTCHIIGFGPAGIFAAFQCLEQGIKPIILERGKGVKERITDIAAIHKKLLIDPDSNYCYGEGGAGTYSDGKLYTRSSKRGDIKKVLDVFIQYGADERIGVEAHPHIGTNKLPRIIENMRHAIIELGGEVHFNKRVTDFVLKDDAVKALVCADGTEYSCSNVILATGHSARDIFELLHKKIY